MNGEAKKLYLIDEIIKTEDEATLSELETVINKKKLHIANRRNFKDFAGMMSNEEAEDFEKIIKEGCEQINPNDWK